MKPTQKKYMTERFENELRKKLGDYERQVPEDIWQGIEGRMHTSRRHRKRLVTLWTATASVAAAICLFVIMSVRNDDRLQSEIAAIERQHGNMQTTAQKALDDNARNIIAQADNAQNALPDGNGRRAEETGRESRRTALPGEADALSAESNAISAAEENGKEHSPASSAQQDNRERTATEADSNGTARHNGRPAIQGNRPTQQHSARREAALRHRTGRERHLEASIYGTGLPSNGAGTDGIYKMYDSASEIMPNEFKNSLMAASHEPEINAKHHIPFKVGVSMRYPLTPKVGIEAGIRYTLLKSTFTFANSRSEYDQTVGMVGVPLAVTYAIYSSRAFDVYGSIGGEAARTVKASDTNDYDLPKPWQLSASAAVGAQYNISPTLGVYVEPGIGYYFDNNSSLRTTYSEHPLSFNISLGLRFTAR